MSKVHRIANRSYFRNSRLDCCDLEIDVHQDSIFGVFRHVDSAMVLNQFLDVFIIIYMYKDFH